MTKIIDLTQARSGIEVTEAFEKVFKDIAYERVKESWLTKMVKRIPFEKADAQMKLLWGQDWIKHREQIWQEVDDNLLKKEDTPETHAERIATFIDDLNYLYCVDDDRNSKNFYDMTINEIMSEVDPDQAKELQLLIAGKLRSESDGETND